MRGGHRTTVWISLVFFEEVLRTAVDALPPSTLVGCGECQVVILLGVEDASTPTLRSRIHPWGIPALPCPGTACLRWEHDQIRVPLPFPLILGCRGWTSQPKGLVPQSVLGLARCSVGSGCWMMDAVLVPYRTEHRVARARTITTSLLQPRGALMAAAFCSTLPGRGSRARAPGV